MLGLALSLALLPVMAYRASSMLKQARAVAVALSVVSLIWLGIALINIRITVPLWSNNTRLWQWDLMLNPRSQMAMANLLAQYIDTRDSVHAHELADRILAEEQDCTLCLTNVAALAERDKDVPRAKRAVELAQTAMGQVTESYVLRSFLLVRAKLRELEHDLEGAAADFDDAIALDPIDPKGRMAYSLFLARQGKEHEARVALAETLPLWAPDVREGHRAEFERTLAAAAAKPSTDPPHDP
jgi:hypothetical protein